MNERDQLANDILQALKPVAPVAPQDPGSGATNEARAEYVTALRDYQVKVTMLKPVGEVNQQEKEALRAAILDCARRGWE